MKPVRLTYRLGREDVAELAVLPGGAPAWRAGFLAGVALIAAAVGWASGGEARLAAVLARHAPYGQLAAVGLPVLLWYMLFVGVRAGVRARAVRGLIRRSGPVRLSAGPAGIAVMEGGSASGFPWRNILDMRLKTDRLLLFARDGRTLVIPKSAFGSATAMNAFSIEVGDALREDDRMNEVAAAAAGGGA